MRRSARFARTLSAAAIGAAVVCAAAFGLALFGGALAAPAQAFPGQFVWTRDESPTAGWDDLFFSARGPGGTLYAVGNQGDYPNNDIWVVKYNANGTQAWSHAWNGPDSLNDDARGIAVDAAGDLYVCGRTKRTATDYDTVVLKYNAAGVLAWWSVWDAGLGGLDVANAVGLDAAGNAYVTGARLTGADAVTLWTASYRASDGDRKVLAERPWPGQSGTRDIAVTPAGVCYVSGGQQTTGSGSDALLWKVTAAGTSWVKAWNGPRGGDDTWVCVKPTSKGGVIVAGTEDYMASGAFAAASYTSSGTRRWVHTWRSSTSGSDRTYDLAVTSGGSAWLAGPTNLGGGHGHGALVKWSASGTRLLTRTMGSSATFADFWAVTVDGNGNAYVAGSMDQAGGARQFLAAKYSPAGRLVWRTRSGFVDPSNDTLETICLGPTGYLYATGYAGWQAADSRGVVVKIQR